MSGAALESYLSAVNVLSAVNILGTALVAAKLLQTGLFRRYPYFFAYLLINTPCYAALVFIPVSSDYYFYLWVAINPIAWFFYIAVVFELYRLILERHKGLYSVGQWAMYVGIIVSVVISALALLPHITPQLPQQARNGELSRVLYFMAAERAVDFSLTIFLLLMMILLAWYAVPLSRNVVAHAVVYTVYFLSTALAMLLRTLFGLKNSELMVNGTAAVSCICLFAWFFLLSKKGEEARVRQPWIGKEQEQRILSQLDAMNAALLRTARK